MENWRLQTFAVRPDVIGRYAGVVGGDGPRILLAKRRFKQFPRLHATANVFRRG